MHAFSKLHCSSLVYKSSWWEHYPCRPIVLQQRRAGLLTTSWDYSVTLHQPFWEKRNRIKGGTVQLVDITSCFWIIIMVMLQYYPNSDMVTSLLSFWNRLDPKMGICVEFLAFNLPTCEKRWCSESQKEEKQWIPGARILYPGWKTVDSWTTTFFPGVE